ncbi:MAG: hypothetical protein Q9167_005849 [Letrouitia subvulpina]
MRSAFWRLRRVQASSLLIRRVQTRNLVTESYARGPLTTHSVVSRHQQTRLTYDALDRKSNAFARGLQNQGVQKGDMVAVSLGNNIEYAIV